MFAQYKHLHSLDHSDTAPVVQTGRLMCPSKVKKPMLTSTSYNVKVPRRLRKCCQSCCGALSREKVVKAMRICARNMFLPEAHRNPDEAFVDSPVRLDALDFNVSAPHMHATCLVSPCLSCDLVPKFLSTSGSYIELLLSAAVHHFQPLDKPMQYHFGPAWSNGGMLQYHSRLWGVFQ